MSAAMHRAARDALSDEVAIEAAAGHERRFAEHPGRTAYVRLATEGEVEVARLHAGWPTDPGPGLRYLVVVRADARWIDSKTFASADAAALTSLDDDGARCLLSALSARQGHGRRPPVVRLDARGRAVV